MYFWTICQKCSDLECCCKPYFAFATKYERARIQDFIKKRGFGSITNEINGIFQEFTIDGLLNEKFYTLRKRENDGKCILLENDGKCAIQEVKPLDCLLWPVTFSYRAVSNSIILYLGDCIATSELLRYKKLESWIQEQKQMFFSKIKKFTRAELTAYSFLISNPGSKILDVIPLNKLI